MILSIIADALLGWLLGHAVRNARIAAVLAAGAGLATSLATVAVLHALSGDPFERDTMVANLAYGWVYHCLIVYIVMLLARRRTDQAPRA